MEIRAGEYRICPVERASTGELAAVLAVYQQCEDFLALGPVPVASAAMVQADLDLSQREGGIFCAIYEEASGAMVGVVDFVLSGYEGNPEHAYLALLMIAAPYRAKGLGATVVAAVEQAIRQDGRARAICSGVQVNNPAAIRFWQRLGYVITAGPIRQADQTITYDLFKPLSSLNS